MKKEARIVESLHPLERSLLPYLENGITVKQLIAKSDLKEVEILRALHWLENKRILRLSKETKDIIELDRNGHEYIKSGLPERRFLQVLKEKLPLEKIKDLANLSQQELEASIGILRRKDAISIEKGMLISITNKGRELLKKQSEEELFLSKLPLYLSQLSDAEKHILNELRKRSQIIRLEQEKEISVMLSDIGKKLAKSDLRTTGIIDSLTPEILKHHSWKDKKFRRYDLNITAPRIYYGKRHFLSQAIEQIRHIWVELGFKEMSGNIVQPSFWNFDALFTAQDHPVRELQDTFFIKNPKHGNLPGKDVISRVRKVHESGWKYTWNLEEAKKNVLRTHTTVLSARTIASLKHSDLPAKFFSISPCFRNEALDWSHLFEFQQTEGIVIDENANFRNLIAYLKEFFKKIGFEKISFRPSYFPYVEPGLECHVYHPIKKKWIELGGAGMFRPEVVKPLLGKDIPVLAWGLGIERIISNYYKLKDIRSIYNNDIKQLRETKVFMR